jgi:hypothetical protein
MPQTCDKEGRWAAAVKEVRAAQSDSGSVMLYVTVALAHLWDPAKQGWVDQQRFDMECKGSFCLITKSNQLMDNTIERLCKALDWDGDPESIATRDWAGTTVQCTTKWDDYKGGRYSVANLYHIDSNPNPRVNLSSDLQMRMQAIARAARTPAAGTTAPAVAAPAAPVIAPPAPKAPDEVPY